MGRLWEATHWGASAEAQTAPEMTLSWLAACMPLACHYMLLTCRGLNPRSAAQDVVAAPAHGGARAHSVAQPRRCSAGAAAGSAAAAGRHQLRARRAAHRRRCVWVVDEGACRRIRLSTFEELQPECGTRSWDASWLESNPSGWLVCPWGLLASCAGRSACRHAASRSACTSFQARAA